MPESPEDTTETEGAETEGAETETEDVFAGDDPKAKFREALARKARGSVGTGGEAGGASKVGSEHGPGKAQRMFRRKSGG